jgi:putative endonuclease
VFCEVKTRRAGPAASPWDALGEVKRDQVRRMAAAWLAETSDRPYSAELRFDAIGVTFDAHGTMVALEHLENAF